MHAAALICEFLTKKNGKMEGIPGTNASFIAVSPNISSESGLPNISLDAGVRCSPLYQRMRTCVS
jgi:hypothetical protein